MLNDVHGWDRLIDLLPSLIIQVIGAVFAGIAMLYGIANRASVHKVEKKVDENTVVTVQKSEESKAEIKSAVKDTKVNAEVAAAAVIMARKNVEKVDKQHDELNTKIDKVVHELNGGFADKVQQAMADHVNETKARFDRIEAKVAEVLTVLKSNL